ncbi:MAG: hypothetical protein AB7E47_10110 [Desulfovibrionaceae bacterium]
MAGVLAAVQRRRLTVVEKVQLVQKSLPPGMNGFSSLASTASLPPVVPQEETHLRRRQGAVQTDDQTVGAGEVHALKKSIRGLERMLVKKTKEVEILQEALEIARKKTALAHSVVMGERFPMKRVAEALTVSRSRLAERLKEPAQGSPPHFSKADDEVLLPLIREIIDTALPMATSGTAQC